VVTSRQFGGPATYRDVAVGERVRQHRRIEGAEALERTKGGDPHAGFFVGNAGASQLNIAGVSGDHDGTTFGRQDRTRSAGETVDPEETADDHDRDSQRQQRAEYDTEAAQKSE
jgi:hypothetical protein